MTTKQNPQIGHVLRAWRQKHDLPVRAASILLGVSPATLSRIERGAPMDMATMLKLINFLFGGVR